jgi:hypothetical protein
MRLGVSVFFHLGAFAAAALGFAIPQAPNSLHQAFNSRQAYAYTAQVAGFGERWPGSPGHNKTEELIRRTLQKDGVTTT